MKNMERGMIFLSLIISHAMCAYVAFQYCSLLWCGRVGGCSAPAWTALFLAIPFAAACGVCLALACLFHRKSA